MNRAPDPHRDDLLADVLAETAPAEFRAALLGETLRLARRRRRVRQATRALPVAAALVIAGFFGWSPAVPPKRPLSAPPASAAPSILLPPVSASYALIRTQSLPTGALVQTPPLSSVAHVVSVASAATIHTPAGRGVVPLVNDAELLALVSPRTAALVRVGSHEQELIFVNGDRL